MRYAHVRKWTQLATRPIASTVPLICLSLTLRYLARFIRSPLNWLGRSGCHPLRSQYYRRSLTTDEEVCQLVGSSCVKTLPSLDAGHVSYNSNRQALGAANRSCLGNMNSRDFLNSILLFSGNSTRPFRMAEMV